MSNELIIALIKANIVLGVLLTNTIFLIWFERKLVAGMQSRVGQIELDLLEFYKQ